MLTLSKDQMTALGRYMEEQFEHNMVEHLRAAFPVQAGTVPVEDLRGTVRFGIAQARAYGVLMEKDIRRYLECMMIYGTRFDTEARTVWAARILRAKSLSGTEKMDTIAVMGRVEAEART